MQAVARRAEVAPGTVLYHYPTPNELAEAVIDTWIDDFGMPTPENIDPTAPIDRRIGTLIELLYDMYLNSEQAYRIYQKSHDHPAMVKSNQMWEENLGALLYTAMGERASDPEAMQVISVLIDPGFRGTLVSRGMSSDRAVEVATTLAVDWLANGSAPSESPAV